MHRKGCVVSFYFWRSFPKFLIAVFFLFILSNLLFLCVLLKRPPAFIVADLSDPYFGVYPKSYSSVLETNFKPEGLEWRLKSHFSPFIADKVEYNCSSLKYMADSYFLGSGWTKSSYKVHLDNHILVYKTINDLGHDISMCESEDQKKRVPCFLLNYLHAGTKILNEIVRLNVLKHKNVIELEGYCVPNRPNVNDRTRFISVITEFGESVDVIKLLTMSWEERLRVALGLSRLIHYLTKSPLGTVSLNDFRRQQFVLASGEIKLIDVDDIGLGDPTCTKESCCLPDTKTKPVNICVPCKNGHCEKYNEKLNILSAGKHFINHILPHGAPAKFASSVQDIIEAFHDASWTSGKILQAMEHLTDMYIKGNYRNASTLSYLAGFKVVPFHDLPGFYDYRCQLTVSGYGCHLSVFDAEEAAAICASDPICKAFVFTQVSTWTGRKMVHFKNGAENYIVNNSTVLYIKM